MASILDRYGIKEVADVTFYELGSDGQPTAPVLYLDTLKVSTIEQTGEEAEARGGKGNGLLILWDYGKEINVSLEDALFSAKSMAIMFGNGKTKGLVGVTDTSGYIMRTETFVATTDATADTTHATNAGWDSTYEGPNGASHTKQNAKFYTEDGKVATTFSKGDKYFCSYDLETANAKVIEISANTFPGVYYVTGDTFARSETTGKDEFFQFIIPKAKVQSENTITLEAEGDPSVFNMNLRVLRPADGVMMKLVKYDLANGTTTTEGNTSVVIHNHTLKTSD